MSVYKKKKLATLQKIYLLAVKVPAYLFPSPTAYLKLSYKTTTFIFVMKYLNIEK